MIDVLGNNLSIGNKVYIVPNKTYKYFNNLVEAIILDINESKEIAKCKILNNNIIKITDIVYRRSNQIVLYKM